MPAETWGNILFQAQLVLRQLSTDGATDRSPEELKLLADQVEKIHSAEWFRVTALHQPPRVVRWGEPVEMEEMV